MINQGVSISVIVPIYNASKYIDRCMRSIYAQTFINYEIILVNDGSKDDSLALCSKYAEKDSRITVIDKENGGAGSARNAGLQIANGKYVYFLDADDEISTNLLERVYNEAEDRQSDLVVFAIKRQTVDSDSGNVLHESTTGQREIYIYTKDDFRRQFSKLYYEGVLFGGPVNKLYKMQIIKDNQIAFPDLRRGQDEIFNFRYYMYTTSCSVMPDILYTYYSYDQKEKNKKYRLEYFENTTITYYRTLNNLISTFGLTEEEYTRRKFDNSFVYSMESTVLLAWNPLEKLNRRQKKEFIQRVCNHSIIREIGTDLSYVPNGYEKFWKVFSSGDCNKIYLVIRSNQIKESLKSHLRKVFRKK